MHWQRSSSLTIKKQLVRLEPLKESLNHQAEEGKRTLHGEALVMTRLWTRRQAKAQVTGRRVHASGPMARAHISTDFHETTTIRTLVLR
jgi:hypothetical protein